MFIKSREDLNRREKGRETAAAAVFGRVYLMITVSLL